MPGRWKIYSLVILLLGAGWTWASRAPAGSLGAGAIAAPQAGFLAPDFKLETLQGAGLSLGDLRGRPVIVNVWATWCPPCRAEMPALERVYQAYRAQGLEVLAVNATSSDSPTAAQAFAQEYGLTFPVLLDAQGSVASHYQAWSLPTTFFVDRQGVIREVVVGGPMSETLLQIRVQQLLEKP